MKIWLEELLDVKWAHNKVMSFCKINSFRIFFFSILCSMIAGEWIKLLRVSELTSRRELPLELLSSEVEGLFLGSSGST